MSRILVTGGFGTIGSPLVDELRSRDHDVWVLDQGKRGIDKYYQADVSSYRQLQSVFEEQEFDYVYHLAAIVGRWAGEDNYENLWEVNAVGTRHLLDLQREFDFRLISFSSSEVYGEYDGVMTEEVPFEEGVRFYNDYAMTKWVNEQQIKNAGERYGTESVRLRPINVYGPPERYSELRSVVSIFCYRALHDIPYEVYEDHVRTFTFIQDFVRTAANVVENFNPGEVYNISGDDTHNIKKLSDIVLDLLDKPDHEVTYKGRDEHTVLEKRASSEKAKQELGHDPQYSLRDGVAETLDWMKDEYGVADV